VIAWTNVYEAEGETNQPAQTGDDRKQVPLSDVAKRLLGAFDTYLELVPDTRKKPTLLFRKARILYEHNRYREAVELVRYVWREFPCHDLAAYAVRLALECWIQLGDHDAVRRALDEVRLVPCLDRALRASSPQAFMPRGPPCHLSRSGGGRAGALPAG
jgi:hypothetical protein